MRLILKSQASQVAFSFSVVSSLIPLSPIRVIQQETTLLILIFSTYTKKEGEFEEVHAGLDPKPEGPAWTSKNTPPSEWSRCISTRHWV